MRFTKVIYTLGLLALSANIFAVRSSDISLKDIVLKPTESRAIEFDKLIYDVNYDVSCIIYSDGASGQSEDVMQMQFGNEDIWLNNDDRVFDHQSFPLATKTPIHMDIFNVEKKDARVLIRNLDDTDTIRVTNCVAKPHIA